MTIEQAQDAQVSETEALGLTLGDMETPLIWTLKGNLPLADLTVQMVREDEADQIKLYEVYTLTATGEEVKRSAHILPLAPWQTGKGGRLEKMGMTSDVGSIG